MNATKKEDNLRAVGHHETEQGRTLDAVNGYFGRGAKKVIVTLLDSDPANVEWDIVVIGREKDLGGIMGYAVNPSEFIVDFELTPKFADGNEVWVVFGRGTLRSGTIIGRRQTRFSAENTEFNRTGVPSQQEEWLVQWMFPLDENHAGAQKPEWMPTPRCFHTAEEAASKMCISLFSSKVQS
jgi:hypothetical protein